MRTGIGFDIHRLIPTTERGSLPIGGISIPCFFRVEAHSDGDVLLHALVDALLGAASLGDIGQRFPDTAQENHGRPSSEFVSEVSREIVKLGYRIAHIDSNVFLEEPKLAPFMDELRRNIAQLLGLEVKQVSVKAKTTEGLGAIGESRALAAQVIVTLAK